MILCNNPSVCALDSLVSSDYQFDLGSLDTMDTARHRYTKCKHGLQGRPMGLQQPARANHSRYIPLKSSPTLHPAQHVDSVSRGEKNMAVALPRKIREHWGLKPCSQQPSYRFAMQDPAGAVRARALTSQGSS